MGLGQFPTHSDKKCQHRRSAIEADLPGLEGDIDLLLRLIDEFSRNSGGSKDQSFCQAVRGALLEGGPGTGKTALAKSLARHGGLPAYYCSCPSLFNRDRGDAERGLQEIFQTCIQKAACSEKESCLLVLDDLDCIGKDRKESRHVSDLGILAMLLECLDHLRCAHVFVLAIAGDASLIDVGLLQPGRLEITLKLSSLKQEQRKKNLANLLGKLNTKSPRAVEESSIQYSGRLLDSLACRTRGFNGADLAYLCSSALASALRRSQSSDPVCIEEEDWEAAMEGAHPVDIPWLFVEGARLSDLAGMDEIIQTVSETILQPLLQPEALRAMGVPRASFGVLLYGPSGTGKTTLGLALAAAAQSHASFLAVECSELVNKVVGESERAVARLFQVARHRAPCILFLDHVEAIAGRRGFDTSSEQTMDRMLSTLLMEMDGLTAGDCMHDRTGSDMVIVVAATNLLSMLDEAFLRPGRLDILIEMALPDKNARAAIFLLHFLRMPLRFDTAVRGLKSEKNSTFTPLHEFSETMADLSEGLSGADIQGLCQEAALLALREDLDRSYLLPRHVMEALDVKRRNT